MNNWIIRALPLVESMLKNNTPSEIKTGINNAYRSNDMDMSYEEVDKILEAAFRDAKIEGDRHRRNNKARNKRIVAKRNAYKKLNKICGVN